MEQRARHFPRAGNLAAPGLAAPAPRSTRPMRFPPTPAQRRAPPRGGAMRGAAGTMASAGGGSLGFLAWLLLLRTRLTEAQEAGAGAQGEATPPSSSPLRSGGGDEDPGASRWETLPGGVRGFPAPQQLGENKNQSSLLAFNSGDFRAWGVSRCSAGRGGGGLQPCCPGVQGHGLLLAL